MGGCLRDIVRVTLAPLLFFFLDGGFLKGRFPFFQPDSLLIQRFRLPIPIMYISMFEVRTSDEIQQTRPFFVWLVPSISVQVGLLTTPLLLQWNIRLKDAFVSTLSVHLQ
jgi:hypothetical protein